MYHRQPVTVTLTNFWGSTAPAPQSWGRRRWPCSSCSDAPSADSRIRPRLQRQTG